MSGSSVSIDEAWAGSLAGLALDGIATEFPNKPGDVMVGPGCARTPRELHPVFYGCFDWHSSVHSHWALVRLLRCCAWLGVAGEVRAALDVRLSEHGLDAEAAYFRERHRRAFERMYGWAWLLRLATELHEWGDPDAEVWARRLEPLVRQIVTLTRQYLPLLRWPNRTGEHGNTAFAMAQMIDYSRGVGDDDLAAMLTARACDYFLDDRDAPVRLEPGGEDFLSPCLVEADLMRRVLPGPEFSAWLDEFLPALRTGSLGSLEAPVEVADMTDGRLGHLAGLNLSRAWAMRSIGATLGENDARSQVLSHAASRHLAAGLSRVESGHYEGEHWLGTFAIFALTDVGMPA
jgi:hypothetical protein